MIRADYSVTLPDGDKREGGLVAVTLGALVDEVHARAAHVVEAGGEAVITIVIKPDAPDELSEEQRRREDRDEKA